MWFQRGREQGRIEGRQLALDQVGDYVSQMMVNTRPRFPTAHTPTCYRIHPNCAVKSIDKFVLRIKGEAQ